MLIVPFPERPSLEPLVEGEHSRAYLLAMGAPRPEDADASVALPDGTRFVFAPRAPGSFSAELAIDPFVSGNAFRPLHDSPRAQSALLSIAAARRVDTGPDSERVFLFLRGSGLLFEENGDTQRYEPNTVALVPAGDPARIWAQGPEDALAIVFQPKAGRAPRRTLTSEIAKKRALHATGRSGDDRDEA